MNWDKIQSWFLDHGGVIFHSLLLLVGGIILIKLVSAAVAKAVRKRFSEQVVMLSTKVVTYGGALLLLIMLLQQWGVQLTALLGAAGIAGAAIGFASQTSLSNLISGLFLIGEKPFQVGDVLTVDGMTGAVFSIDLLSVKFRTLDNKFVRIPNETLVKAQITNITRFPIRRLDIDIGVAYKEDMKKVMAVLLEIADKNPFSLDEPAPIVVFKGFGSSSIDFMLGVWFAKEDFLSLKNSIMVEIKERFDREGIEIPFPHLSLYSGGVTEPFPVRVMEGEKAAAPAAKAG